MALSESLLALATLFAALAGAVFAFVAWSKRPRYRRGRQGSGVKATHSSASFHKYLGRTDEGSSLSVRSPRKRTGLGGVPVADVDGDNWVGGAEVPFEAVR